MKQKILKHFSITISLLLALLFVAKFGGPAILRLYIETGSGDCEKIPIFCMEPTEEIQPNINKVYIAGLLPYEFTDIKIRVPEGFNVVKGKTSKEYYKKRKKLHQHSDAVIYLFHEKKDFFINLFPQVKKQGIKSDFAFIKRTMYAKLKDVKDLTDAFFVIMKGIFTPDLGEQRNVKMAQFVIADKQGFINYNLAKSDNYFDCNIINKAGDFFKVYIKDKGASLDLDKVLAIISTLN